MTGLEEEIVSHRVDASVLSPHVLYDVEYDQKIDVGVLPGSLTAGPRSEQDHPPEAGAVDASEPIREQLGHVVAAQPWPNLALSHAFRIRRHAAGNAEFA
jgi:hypothetical protein